jgi:hypothetical protein
MTFREKSIAIQIAAILAVYSFYGLRYWGQPLTGPGAGVALVAGITFSMIVVTVIAHIAIGGRSRPEKQDERDRVIGLRGSRNAYYVLAVTNWCLLWLILTNTRHGLVLLTALVAFAVAELVRLGSKMWYYRLGT